jgi:hypothetical protein
MHKKYKVLIVLGVIGWIGINQSCTHDSFIIENINPDPMDTIVIDTMVMDTTLIGTPCDSNLIYFNQDILPILKGSCAISGCHDANTATKGVVLDNYNNVINTADVLPFNLNESELYEVITEDNLDKVMPPTGKLDNETIGLIAQWILQGADNLECDNSSEECIQEDISYIEFVSGVFQTSCNGCHNSTSAFGGVILDNYSDVKTIVDNDRLFGAINWDQGFSQMPQGQEQLDSCTILKIKSWIDEGAKNN